MAKKKAQVIPCAYGNVNVGDRTVAISVSVDRKRLSLDDADRLCGKRLTGRLNAVPGNDNPDQGTLDGMDAEETLSGVFDVKRFGFSPKAVTTTLSFLIESIDLPTLCSFAKRAGAVVVEDVADIPEDEAGDE